MPSLHSKPKFQINNLPVHKTNSLNNFVANTFQKSGSKECEQSEQLSPISPIYDFKSTNHRKFSKLGAKLKSFIYKDNATKKFSLYVQNYSANKFIAANSINSNSKMPCGKSTKSTPTKARVNFSYNSPTNTTPGANNNSSSTETTPSTSARDTADDLRLSETINRVFTKITLAILTVKDAIQKEARDCVIRKDEKRLKDISFYLHSYWRNMSVKHGCLCLDDRKAIPNAIKDALLEYIHSAHPGSFARLSFSQNAWWPYIHRDILSKASE